MSHIQKYTAWNLPNIISVLRILAAPLLILLLLSPDKKNSLTAAIVFAAASLTDWLDGYLARRLGVETTFGRFLDPLADKLLIVTCLIMLISVGGVPAWMVAIIAGREIAVTGLRSLASIEGVVIAAGSLGKYKTAFQIASATALIIHYKFFGIDFHTIGIIFLWIALVFTLWSGIDYFVKFLRKVTISM
ncbi:MAG: CDP-diacylglycerol--glycerol-3-phosphate 3-phosphatidyltransferase [Deltaproteobacteria bacterium]|nr:CDP-diacylglycerol--glycerol-3-phosphate 3-phosphatidyltransferase [Deltaproteobacteria bacterium]